VFAATGRSLGAKWQGLRRVGQSLVIAALAAGCAVPNEDAPDSVVEAFAEDVPVLGRVVENSTACEVDAVCYLRIEFFDTSVIAVYGTGERPAPPCEMSTELSDIAFAIRRGELVSVVISKCADEGYFIRRIHRRS